MAGKADTERMLFDMQRHVLPAHPAVFEVKEQ
jgi:hypothetical protein